MVDIRALSASHADRANGKNGRSKRMSKLRSKRPSSDIVMSDFHFIVISDFNCLISISIHTYT